MVDVVLVEMFYLYFLDFYLIWIVCHLYHAFICSFIPSIHLPTQMTCFWLATFCTPIVLYTVLHSFEIGLKNIFSMCTLEKIEKKWKGKPTKMNEKGLFCLISLWHCFMAVWLAGCQGSCTTTFCTPEKHAYFFGRSWIHCKPHSELHVILKSVLIVENMLLII